jgi:proteasome accessory factor C
VPRLSAEARLHRLLALVPWVASHDGPLIADVCARFGCTEQELVDDVQLLFLCGLHPYTPDMLIDVDIAEGRVWIRYADYFSRPLRLTPAEGLALLAAGQVALAGPGTDETGPLARGLRKLSAALGVGDGEAVEVALTPAAAEVLGGLRDAAAQRRQVEIEYYSFGRDRWSERVVDPYAVFSAGGQWYLSAWCHAVDDERLFRVDRVRRARVLDTTFPPPARQPDFAVYRPRPEDPRVTLELEPAARWVVDQYPAEAVEELDGGRVRVRLAVSEQAWLERLLLRLGTSARVVEGDARTGPEAACRLLARYSA